ncbi:hypothetical protein HF521_021396 [Silurus meridionalis]|uniref:small monomeric GTPase n=1 Tax=Silurus meridionalis TaxID=175797 RepID=A0A8T0BB75_SILME|nr:hypothetical protein HF521_021396 [Silurus meridionalis]
MAKKTYDLLFKLLLIGDSGVGKTCVLFRFSDDAFNTTFISTIGIDFKIKTVELNGKRIKLQIWDTAGQERFHTITTSYYRGAMGILLVYDITNAKSFENISKWLRNIEEHANEDVERMLLGNKCDMEDMRVVPKAKGEQIASEHNIRFFETSAKANINIEKAFLMLAQDILQKTPGKEPTNENVDMNNRSGSAGGLRILGSVGITSLSFFALIIIFITQLQWGAEDLYFFADGDGKIRIHSYFRAVTDDVLTVKVF